MGQRISLISVFTIGLSFGMSGCNKPVHSSGNPTVSASIPKSETIFEVVKPDGSKIPFLMNDLKNLPLTTMFAEGSPQEGPTLLAVLKSAKVEDFKEVAVTGREGTKILPRSEVTDQLVLDFNNRGSVKLASPTMPRDERIRDITRIEIK